MGYYVNWARVCFCVLLLGIALFLLGFLFWAMFLIGGVVATIGLWSGVEKE